MAKKTAFPSISAAAKAYFTEHGLDSTTEAVVAFLRESGFTVTDATANNIRQAKYQLQHKSASPSKPGRRGSPKKAASTRAPKTAPKAKSKQAKRATMQRKEPNPKQPIPPVSDDREALRRMIMKVGTSETQRILESLQ